MKYLEKFSPKNIFIIKFPSFINFFLHNFSIVFIILLFLGLSISLIPVIFGDISDIILFMLYFLVFLIIKLNIFLLQISPCINFVLNLFLIFKISQQNIFPLILILFIKNFVHPPGLDPKFIMLWFFLKIWFFLFISNNLNHDFDIVLFFIDNLLYLFFFLKKNYFFFSFLTEIFYIVNNIILFLKFYILYFLW